MVKKVEEVGTVEETFQNFAEPGVIEKPKFANVQECRHVIMSQDIQELNNSVAGILNDGWRIAEVRSINLDYNSKIFTILYVFVR